MRDEAIEIEVGLGLASLAIENGGEVELIDTNEKFGSVLEFKI